MSNKTIVIDPDHVQETPCLGPFNVSVTGPLALLTFTHERPDASAMFSDGTVVAVQVVRARIILPTESLQSLRDALIQILDKVHDLGQQAVVSVPSKLN